RGDGGSGLGLYICYNIVTTQLAGNITCVSAPGDGTHFYIEHEI
ncbi:MAG: HAMP domain-containing histidine kinase, partial [Gammaproteobacteria bacterium]|nr:HAMP domain-containing histidine kinase [Gammaproteobacteria bacterium]